MYYSCTIFKIVLFLFLSVYSALNTTILLFLKIVVFLFAFMKKSICNKNFVYIIVL